MTESKKPTILVVDDEPAIRESIKQFLIDLDYDVQTAETGEVALDLVRQQAFDIAIVDMRLPEMSGDMFILKAHEIQKETQYLVLTGSVDYVINPELVRIGINSDQILQKPLVSLFKLAQSIETLLWNKNQ